MHNNKNIYCVWYPSGGFGHFINTVLTQYGTDFVRPINAGYQFSATGNSHNNELVAPKFMFDCVDYEFNFVESDRQYSVLIDNGIGNESKKFINTFPQAKIIKVCYSTLAWPVVASTAIHKAMESNFDSELVVDQPEWSSSSNWAQREKYFLFLAAHHHRMMWKPESDHYNLLVDDMLNYNVFYSRLGEFGIELTDFSELWDSWYKHNQKYISPVVFAKKVIDAIDQNQSMDLSHCQDLWSQAVVNYFIWDKFNYTVPANDFANWFTNTDQIIALLAQQHASA